MEPTFLEHAEFGRAEWNSTLCRYEGSTSSPLGETIRLSISPFDNFVPGQEPAQLDGASALTNSVAEELARILDSIDAVKQFVSSELLEQHNWGDWCRGKPIDSAEFAARLTVTDIVINEDLDAQVFFDDGDLFWGHAVIVDVDRDGQATNAQLFG